MPGKTTLARQISEWAIQSGPSSGLSDHPILPIWVDEELDSDKKTLPLIVKGRLVAALPEEMIEDELFAALLKKQRLSPAQERHRKFVYVSWISFSSHDKASVKPRFCIRQRFHDDTFFMKPEACGLQKYGDACVFRAYIRT